MGIESEFFFEDKDGNIRFAVNDEVFNIITSERKEANEVMLVLLTEMFRELKELSDELVKYDIDEKIQNLIDIVNQNHMNYIINQERVLQRIAELESGN